MGNDNNECADLFKSYQKCLTVCEIFLAIQLGARLTRKQVAIRERGIDKLVDEAREDQKENDAIHMNRKCEFDDHEKFPYFLRKRSN